VSQPRIPRIDDLVNVPEFEEIAKLKLDPAAYASIAGGDRAGFDRITFRPRMMVPTLDLDLGVELFGETHFTPIIVGPVSEQRRYHPEGESATVRGAAIAGAGMIVSSKSSVPIVEIAAQARTPLWYAVYGDSDSRRQIDQALAAGCKAVCVTTEPSGKPDWKRIANVRRDLAAPMVVKGVMTAADAKIAIDNGVNGVVVSDHGTGGAARSAPIDVLPSIADACAGRAAVFVDGSFRRGSDIVKALALGAQGVLLARPVMWGLAGYGAEGVQAVIEMLQSDVGRNMGALGAPSVKTLTRNMVRINRR
jgi:isopentenyl diphosphate isomerase/L-lactate dehydrogenase-like FMN-dependent dehydrogenase